MNGGEPMRSLSRALLILSVALALSGSAISRGGVAMAETADPRELLQTLAAALAAGQVKVVDLTSPLSEDTPVIQLPPPLANSPGLKMHLISKYDEKGPAWYWNWMEVGEHTGTHFDAPCHWITGKDKPCLDLIDPGRLIGPAAVIDVTREVEKNPDYILTKDDILAWEAKHGRLPKGAWVLLKTGWSKRITDPKAFFNVDEKGMPHTPGFSKESAEFLTRERDVLGVGTECIGTDAGIAATFRPPFPNHNIMHGAGGYGLTMLQNLDQLPEAGAIVIAAPLKIMGGSGSPVRVLALVPGR